MTWAIADTLRGEQALVAVAGNAKGALRLLIAIVAGGAVAVNAGHTGELRQSVVSAGSKHLAVQLVSAEEKESQRLPDRQDVVHYLWMSAVDEEEWQHDILLVLAGFLVMYWRSLQAADAVRCLRRLVLCVASGAMTCPAAVDGTPSALTDADAAVNGVLEVLGRQAGAAIDNGGDVAVERSGGFHALPESTTWRFAARVDVMQEGFEGREEVYELAL